MEVTLWQKCLVRLEHELPEQQFNTWIRPLHAIENGENLRLLAPNQFVLDWVRKHHFDTISQTLHEIGPDSDTRLQLDIGSSKKLPLASNTSLSLPAAAEAVTTAPAVQRLPGPASLR